MRWYFNDVSLQGQFRPFGEGLTEGAPGNFEHLLKSLMAIRSHVQPLQISRSLPDRLVSPGTTFRLALQQSRNRDLKRLVLLWLDRTGPFIEDDRLGEADDLFMCCGIDVTDSGLGEAARRVKARVEASTFSVPGGDADFARSPIVVTHGLSDEPIGEVRVQNVWSIAELRACATNEEVVKDWRDLVLVSRQRFTHLLVPDAIFLNKALAREPFSDIIARQALALLSYLNSYMDGRGPNGEEGAVSRDIYENFFIGSNALFTGESPSNQVEFRTALTFQNQDGGEKIFAHYHGKISHRFFRLHFEFPVPKDDSKLRILYLGPKLTKS